MLDIRRKKEGTGRRGKLMLKNQAHKDGLGNEEKDFGKKWKICRGLKNQNMFRKLKHFRVGK